MIYMHKLTTELSNATAEKGGENYYSFADVRTSSQVFFLKGVLKNFAIFTGKHLRYSLFLIKLQAHSNTGIFL